MITHARYVYFTTDMWTCQNNYSSFWSFTAHWVNTEFNLKHVALNIKHFNEAHTAQNIAKALQKLCSMWKIETSMIHVAVNDNDCNIVKAVNEAKLTSICCFIHRLQLIVYDPIKVSCARRVKLILIILPMLMKSCMLERLLEQKRAVSLYLTNQNNESN